MVCAGIKTRYSNSMHYSEIQKHLQKASAAHIPAGRTRVTAGNFDGRPPGTLDTRGSSACIFLLRSPPRILPPNSSIVPAASTDRVCWHAAIEVMRADASLLEAEACTVDTSMVAQLRVAMLKAHRSLMQPWPVATDTPPCTYTCIRAAFPSMGARDGSKRYLANFFENQMDMKLPFRMHFRHPMYQQSVCDLLQRPQVLQCNMPQISKVQHEGSTTILFD